MAAQETVTLTRAQVEDLRAIIHNADSPLGNRLQDVSARLYFALDGAGWTPAPVAAPEPVLCVSSKEFKRMRAGDDSIKAWLPPTTSAEDMPLYATPPAAIAAREQEDKS